MKINRQNGFTLLELMIALSIGTLLIGGTVAMMRNSGDALRRNETNADMVSAIRLASNTIRHDVQSAGYFGRTRYSGDISGRANDKDPLPALPGDCFDGFYIDIQRYLYATDGINPFADTCIPAGFNYAAGTDVLIVRFAQENGITAATPIADLDPNGLYIYSNPAGGELFRGNTPPSASSLPFAGDFVDQIGKRPYELVTHVYFIGSETENSPLGLYRLEPSNAADAPFRRLLIASDIENLQVAFGIDDCDPQAILGANTCDGIVDQYVNPGADELEYINNRPAYSAVPRILTTAVSFTALSDEIKGSDQMLTKDHWLKGNLVSSSTASIFQAVTFQVRNSEEIL